jgi:hypothetical protein
MTQADRMAGGSYVGCSAGSLSRGEYLDRLAAAGFTDASITFTAEAAPGMCSGSTVTGRRHLATALRELGDTAITSAVAVAEGTFEDQVTAHDPGLRVVHEHSETVHGSATVCKRPDRP